MKQKVLALLLVGTMAAGALAGCGSSDSSDTSDTGTDTSAETETGASDDENTLTLWAWDPSFNIPAMEAAEAAYQEKNPDFKLNIVTQSASSDIEDAITLAGSSGDYSNLPDIVLFQDHYFNRYLADYPDAWDDSVASADIDWDEFSQEKLSYSTVDGTHYGVPVDNGTVIFAYNTEALAAAGYTIDDVTGITWDEFDEIGKAVKEATGKYLLCMDGDGNDLPYMMLQAEGVSQFSDGKANLAGNETFKEIIEVIVKLQQDGVLLLSNDWDDYTNNAIQGDQAAGVMNGNWIIPTIELVEENSGKWEITTMPTLSGEEGYATNGGSSLYITSNTKNAELAVDFLTYTFGGGDGALATYDAALTDGGVISTYAPAGESDVYQQGVAYFNDQPIYSDIVEMGTHVEIVEQSDYHYSARSQVASAIQNIINGTDIDTAIQDAQDQLDFEMSGNGN